MRHRIRSGKQAQHGDVLVRDFHPLPLSDGQIAANSIIMYQAARLLYHKLPMMASLMIKMKM